MRPITGDIRKITVGDPKSGMAWQVGSPIYKGANVKISKIEMDYNNMIFGSGIAYYVWIESEEGLSMWKKIENQPVVVEFYG